MAAPNRVPAGVPTGGRFAPSSRPEPALELDAVPSGRALPVWGPALQTAIDDAVEKWTIEDFDDGDETRDLAELVSPEGDEDELIAAYGERRADWLINTKLTASGATRLDYVASFAGPAEYSTRGVMSIHRDGKKLRTAKFTHEDPPDLGNVLNLCPAAECPECGRESDQDGGIPCSACLSRKCARCGMAEPEGADGLCADCRFEEGTS